MAADFLYSRVIRYVSENAWAVQPHILTTMMDVLRFRAGGERISAEEIKARLPADHGRGAAGAICSVHEVDAAKFGAAGTSAGAVAVIPIYGVISQRQSLLDDTSSSGAGLDRFLARFNEQVANPAVGTIVLDINSPGGSVAGVPEAAAEIYMARSTKRIVAVANSLAASAAYWLAAAANEIVITPSGQVGSIGVFSVHQDLSKQLDEDGVKVTLISAGKYKTEGNPFGPLDEEALAAIQSTVDAYYSQFVADVASGRGVKAGDVRNGYGQGRTFTAQDAVAAKLADRIDTLDGVLNKLLGRKVGASISAETEAPAVAAEALDAPSPLPNASAPGSLLDLRRRRFAMLGAR